MDETPGLRTQELVQANRRLALLTRVANSFIIAAAPHENLRAAFDAVAAEIGAKFYFYYKIDETAPDMLALQSSGGLERLQENTFRRIETSRSLAGVVATTLDAEVTGDIDLSNDESTAPLRALGVKAHMAFPLLAHGNLLGIIAFGSIMESRFGESDIELVRTLTHQCAALLNRSRLVENLRESEARYRIALSAGRIGTWETDYLSGVRRWSEEGMALFGLSLAEGRGHVGGEADEYVSALHPEDRHLAKRYRELADKQDSFPAEYRIVRPDGSVLWLSGQGHVAARGLDGRAHRLISIMIDITERKKSEDHIQFLMREMSHRSKNLLAVIQAIASQTVRTAGSMEEFASHFHQRLRGLATSHDVLVDQNWQGAPLADLVNLHVAPFVGDDSSRLGATGPAVVVTATAAQAIGLALNELATNAAKYGSLSTPAGRVAVAWSFEDDSGGSRRLNLTWAERGGPLVKAPSRKGFGHLVIERMVANSLDGQVAIDFAPHGVTWTLSIPAANTVASVEMRPR